MQTTYRAGATCTTEAQDVYRAGTACTTEAQTASQAGMAETLLLFTTQTCPNCKIAKEMLRNETYQIVDAAENPDLVSQFGIMQAPTLIVQHDGKAEKYVNASNIKRFVDGRKALA